MRRNIVVAISIVLVLAACIGIAFGVDYFAKRNGKTTESRELILQENYEGDFLICERKIDGMIFSAYELSNGRTGVAEFKEEENGYRAGRVKFSDADVPNVQMEVLNEKYCYVIFLNQPNMEYVTVVYEVTTSSGEREEVSFRYDLDDDRLACSESPQGGEPKYIVYVDEEGQQYKFAEDPEGTREYYVKIV